MNVPVIRAIPSFQSIKSARLTIRNKILLGCVGVALISTISLAMVATFSASSTIHRMAENDLNHMTDSLLNLCMANFELNQRTVNHNINVADHFVRGKTALNRANTVAYRAVNQITGEGVDMRIPSMYVGAEPVSGNFGLIDRVTEMIGGTVTIFQTIKNPDGLLRISTSVKKQDGSRAVGTFIPASSPVYQKIMQGETYRGTAFVVNDWYITAYKPITERGGGVIGAVYVGVKQSEQDILRNKILAMKLGARGATYVIDNHDASRGTLLIHPTREGKNIYNEKDDDGNLYVQEIFAKKSGSGVFPLVDSETGSVNHKIISYRSFDAMGWMLVSEADYDEVYSPLKSMRRMMIFIGVLCTLFIVFVSVYFSNSLSMVVKRVVGRIQMLRDGDFSKDVPAEDMEREDEFGEMAQMFNQLIGNTRELLLQIRQTTDVLTHSIQDLTVSSKEISTTSNQQAASVKEIVSTMEDSDSLSKKVAERINEVARIANQTREFVERGYAIIKSNLEKMDEIQNTNSDTITGIRSLGTQIESIWEVVNIINGIADQTKIIAFNAELEASAAGEAGRNFQIVATEVRRLADSTVASTTEIKARIDDIQRSSDNLILASEKGTERIREGWSLSTRLKEIFDEIKNSAEISAASSGQIVSSVGQQVSAFEQILLTLKQISEGIDDFAVTTRATTGAAESLREMGDGLRETLSKYNLSQDGGRNG
jgi:methyl-accepting chemotaxis protein